MPTSALETSKRKFHKLLDNLTNSVALPHPSRATNTNNAHPVLEQVEPSHASPIHPAKKRRLSPSSQSNPTIRVTSAETDTPSSNGTTTATTRTSLKPGSLRHAALLRKRPHPTSTETKPPEQLPRYCPWSHEAFLARLKTFSNVSLWSSKPAPAVNEVAWAKRGWTLCSIPSTIPPNTVACKACGRHVVVSLRPARRDSDGKEIEGSEDFAQEVDDAVVARFAELTADGHGEGCLWRLGGGCTDEIYRMPIVRPSVWEPQLRERYWSFVRIGEALPDIGRLSVPVDVEAVARLFPGDFFVAKEDSTNREGTTTAPRNASSSHHPINLAALSFSLLGWTAQRESPSPSSTTTAQCTACFRRLPLWMYTTRSGEDTSELDLQDNHRGYCPWINPETQLMPGSFTGMAGWQILCKVVGNSAAGWRRRRRRARDGSERADGIADERDASPDEEREVAASKGDRTSHRRSGSSASTVSSSKTREEVEKEDKARFRRLRELTRSIGLKKAFDTAARRV